MLAGEWERCRCGTCPSSYLTSEDARALLGLINYDYDGNYCQVCIGRLGVDALYCLVNRQEFGSYICSFPTAVLYHIGIHPES